jgi:hypothetical protein
LRSLRPSRETSSLASHINNIILSIRASIRTIDKLLTLFFSFPSFYERQTPFPTPPRAPSRLRNPKAQLQLTNFQLPIPNGFSRAETPSSRRKKEK